MQNSGIVVPPEKSYLIETRLSKIMADAGIDSFGEFYNYIISHPDPLTCQKIINAMTTNETLWFRDSTPWKVLQEKTLPKLVEEIASGKRTRARIWCAAVSTGQEVYSTVMCVDDYLRKNRIKGVELADFDFFATDISSRVLDIAKKGRYDAISIMRGLDEYYKSRYFTKDGSAWDIDPKIREAVRFAQFNLQNNYHIFGMFDIIFCRYVLIYFSDAQKKEIITKMRDVLAGDGLLFTGNYVLFDLFKDDFNSNHCENLTYYSKRDPGQSEPRPVIKAVRR
jgi:chemotaxis protein methyltransferase CheR